MREIKCLSGMIEDEIKDADKYARKALEYKDSNRRMSETFYTLANEELKHMSMLHAEVVRLIDDYRRSNGDPPPEMQAVYDILHARDIEDVKAVKIMLAMFAE